MSLKDRISDHQEGQAFRGEVIELLDTAQQLGREKEKTKHVLKCLLSEDDAGSTDEFWKVKVLQYTHGITKQV